MDTRGIIPRHFTPPQRTGMDLYDDIVRWDSSTPIEIDGERVPNRAAMIERMATADTAQVEAINAVLARLQEAAAAARAQYADFDPLADVQRERLEDHRPSDRRPCASSWRSRLTTAFFSGAGPAPHPAVGGRGRGDSPRTQPTSGTALSRSVVAGWRA